MGAFRVDGASRRERVDAARNRERVLRAAAALFAERGAVNVSMEDVARAAGVGKATLYRRYPDRAMLAVALLDQHERELEDQLVRGGPPLGPGAPPAERLAAFYAAMVDLLDRHLDLALAAETGDTRYRTGAYGAWRAHVLVLLREAGVDDAGGALADILLAPLSSECYRHVRQDMEPSQVAATLAALAHRVLGEGSGRG
jgi:AcrR family transcriptional regulator